MISLGESLLSKIINAKGLVARSEMQKSSGFIVEFILVSCQAAFHVQQSKA